MLKSFRYRIFPSELQKKQLANYFGVVRVVYNLGLETKTHAYATHKVSISKYDLIKQLPDLKKECEWIADAPSKSLQHVLINLDTAYQNFFKGRGAFPKFKNKYKKQSMVFPEGGRVDFQKRIVRLPKLKDVSVDFSREFKGELRRITLSKTTTNKYFISVLVDNKKELPKKPSCKESTAIGIDLGIKDLAITSDGIVYKNKNFLKDAQKKLRIEQRSLARKQKGSKSRERQRLRVALAHEKVRNQRIDYLHKISTELIQNYDTIVLEDLAVSNMVKNHYLAKAISDMGWRELRTMIEYKAEWYGKNVLTIGRFEPSSKICSGCGNIKKELKLSDRVYKCESCDLEIDRDLNAALNIKTFGFRAEPVSRQRKSSDYA